MPTRRSPKPPSPPADLARAYADRHLALGLGAGVSKDSRLPDWNELVRRIGDATPGVGGDAVRSLQDAGFDATAIATILAQADASGAPFAERVRAALYRDFAFPDPVGKHNHRAFAAFVRASNPTLHAVGTLCGIAVGPDRFEANPRLRAVLTLNMDDLLETYTAARFKKRVLRTVERAAASASGSRIHSYHLHGYLKRHLVATAARSAASQESPDRLVLTEAQYVETAAAAHGFVNYTLLFLLREYRFLFVGLSMADPNLRRALHLSFAERVRELRAEGRSADGARADATRHWAVMQRRGRTLDAATTTLLAVLGVGPLWVDDFAQIPALLAALYETPRRPEGGPEHRWLDVA